MELSSLLFASVYFFGLLLSWMVLDIFAFLNVFTFNDDDNDDDDNDNDDNDEEHKHSFSLFLQV